MQTDTYIKMNTATRNEGRLIRKEVVHGQKFAMEKITQFEKGDISRFNFVSLAIWL